MKPIEMSDLTKYYGRTRGIEGVTLEVEQGDIFGFIGHNSAGKTTAILTLLDLIFPTSGGARVFGMDSHSQSKEIKRDVSYLPAEDYYYKNMNAYQLLRYSARIHRLEPRSCQDRMEQLASHLELDLKAKIKSLSRGNRRKVSIIRCLLPGAKLLILDEPTSGLDPLMQIRLFELLKEEQEKGTTIFFSSHILSDVQKICNRVAIIRKGQIVLVDEVDALEREHLKKITLELDPPFSVDQIEIEGVSALEITDHTVRFLYQGSLGELLEYLVKRKIHDHLNNLLIERSTLDEIFIDYYRERDQEHES